MTAFKVGDRVRVLGSAALRWDTDLRLVGRSGFVEDTEGALNPDFPVRVRFEDSAGTVYDYSWLNPTDLDTAEEEPSYLSNLSDLESTTPDASFAVLNTEYVRIIATHGDSAWVRRGDGISQIVQRSLLTGV